MTPQSLLFCTFLIAYAALVFFAYTWWHKRKEKPKKEFVFNEQEFIDGMFWLAKQDPTIFIDLLNKLQQTPTARQLYLEYHEKFELYEQCEIIKKHIQAIPDKT